MSRCFICFEFCFECELFVDAVVKKFCLFAKSDNSKPLLKQNNIKYNQSLNERRLGQNYTDNLIITHNESFITH
jgi:hypothetical protein